MKIGQIIVWQISIELRVIQNLLWLRDRRCPTFNSNNCTVLLCFVLRQTAQLNWACMDRSDNYSFTQFCAQPNCTVKLSVYGPLNIGIEKTSLKTCFKQFKTFKMSNENNKGVFTFDCILFSWIELNQWKYGPNICRGDGRCETGLYRVKIEIHASTVRSGEEKRTILLFNTWFSVIICLNPVQCYQVLGLHLNIYFVQASSVQGNHRFSWAFLFAECKCV